MSDLGFRVGGSVAANDFPPAFSESTYHGHSSASARPLGAEAMRHATGQTHRRFSGVHRNTTSRVSTREFSDWIKDQAQRYTEKELADVTGMSIKAAQNLRAGKSGAHGPTLATWCMNDHDFAAAYAEYVGLILPGEAEFAGAFTKAVNAYNRRRGVE